MEIHRPHLHFISNEYCLILLSLPIDNQLFRCRKNFDIFSGFLFRTIDGCVLQTISNDLSCCTEMHRISSYQRAGEIIKVNFLRINGKNTCSSQSTLYIAIFSVHTYVRRTKLKKYITGFQISGRTFAPLVVIARIRLFRKKNLKKYNLSDIVH